MSKLTAYNFGDLPVELINRTLALELDAGAVVMSVNAQRHVQNKRPSEFARLFPHVAAVIANPLYIGDDFKNEGKIELVGAPIALGAAMLVAVKIERDANGNYTIASFYPVGDAKIANRRAKNHLLIPKQA